MNAYLFAVAAIPKSGSENCGAATGALVCMKPLFFW